MRINGIKTEELQSNGYGPDGLPPCRPRGAFTLIELLVVIAIIGILAALLLPVLTAAKQRALRARCLANVKQFDLAFISYAIDNNDKLPFVRATIATGDSDQNPMQIQPPIIDMMIHQYGLTRDVLYCPAYPEFNNEWNTNVPFIGYTGVVGYCTSAPGAPVFDSNYTIAPVTGVDYLSQLVVTTQPSKRTLVADMVPSNRKPGADTNSTAMSDYIFIGVAGDLADNNGSTTMRASHVNSKRQPVGGNEGMLDGHGTWVKFTDMLLRTGYDDPDNDSPYFWW